MKGAAVQFPIVYAAAGAIGIHPLNLELMHPLQARKLAREAARIHEGRREMAARALDALEVFDEVLADAPGASGSVSAAFARKAVPA